MEGFSLLKLVNVVLKQWKLVVALPVAAGIVAAVVSLTLPPKYTATTTFLRETGSRAPSLPGGLVGLASQFGLLVPEGGQSSPRFYADLLRSRSQLEEALHTDLPDPRTVAPNDTATLLDILEIDSDLEAGRLEAGRETLEGMMSVGVDRETGVLSLSIESRFPTLSADIANLFVALVNQFNLETRQSNARQLRHFAQERVTESEAELREAEEGLKRFLEQNRQFDGSPELQFQYERLQRQVAMKQELLTALRRQYEEARIQEVNDAPVITVIDRAVPPQKRSSPKRKRLVILAFFLAGILGTFGAFGRDYVERARGSDDADLKELTSQWDGMKGQFRSLISRALRFRRK